MAICSKDICTGCGACLNRCPKDAISMVPDEEGFAYPQIDESKCINCGLCRKACPALDPVVKNPKPDYVYAAWAKEDRIRCASSSGGLFSVLAEHVLNNGGVVNGVAFEEGLNLRHRLITTVDELSVVRGSKYVQSDVGTVYREVKRVLDAGKTFLFTSTPCQVAGLKAYLVKDYENLITVDILCHGVPSPQFFKKAVCAQFGTSIQENDDFGYRNLKGWGYLSTYFSDGRSISIPANRFFYHKAFLSGLSFRESCYLCPYASFTRVGDLTLGDFWGVSLRFRLTNDIRKGCSLVLLNTIKGKRFFDSLKDGLFFNERNMRECRANHQLYRPVPRPKLRSSFYPLINKASQAEIKLCCENMLRPSVCRWLINLPARIKRKAIEMAVGVFWRLKNGGLR